MNKLLLVSGQYTHISHILHGDAGMKKKKKGNENDEWKKSERP